MKKILIISTNAVGDTYLSLSAVPILKKISPECSITFLCNSKSRFLFNYYSVDDLIVLENKSMVKIFNLLIELRDTDYEEIYSFFPGRLNSLLLLIAKGRNKSGYINFRENIDWHKNAQKIFYKPRSSKRFFWNPSKNYLDRISIILNQHNISKIKIDISDQTQPISGAVIIHPFSKDYRRQISTLQIEKLFGFFKDRALYIHGTEDELEEIDFGILPKVKKILTNENISEFILTLKLNIFISTDSFPLHLADSYNTNFLGLFTHTNPKSVLVNVDKSVKFNSNSFDEINLSNFEKKVNTKLNSLGYFSVAKNKNS